MQKVFSSEVKEICSKIGESVLEYNGGDYNKANDYINMMGLIDVVVTDKRVELITSRPGMCIGKLGNLVNIMFKHIGRHIHIGEQNNVSDLCHIYNPDYDW